MTCSILVCRKFISASGCRLAKPLLSSTCRDRALRVGVVGTGMMFNCAFASGHGRACLPVGFGAGPLVGFGPSLLLKVQTYSRDPSGLTVTEVGYQPVGIRPLT